MEYVFEQIFGESKVYIFGEGYGAKIHIVPSGTDIKINSWHDNDMGIEVSTDNGSYYFSEGTYIMYEKTCPICGK